MPSDQDPPGSNMIRPGSRESLGRPGSKETLNAPPGSKELIGSSPEMSGCEGEVKREERRKLAQKELEKRYPKNGTATTSDEDKSLDRKKNGPVAKTDKLAAPDSLQLPIKKRLIQISCEEVGRVNRPIDDEPYYHGFMTRTEADKLLKKDGEFLVRKTEVGGQLHFVLSVIHDGNMRNYLIKRTIKKRLYWVYKYAFKTVGDLVQYHYRNREPIGAEGFLLVKPCFKKEWQLNNEQVERTSKLGEGAFGEVWKGSLQVSPFLPRIPVAVKTLHTGSLSGDERIKFLKEANLMLSLNHPNVVKLYGVCTAKEPIMIVMELANGGSLLSRVEDKENPPTMDEKLNFVYGGVKGMAYLEGKKIIHRDIAARNCLLGANQVKISDFGLSMLGNEFREKKMKNVPLRWLAPETLKRGRYTSKSDVYSFGVMIFEVYSAGREPYEGVENKELRMKIIEHKIALEVKGEIQQEVEEVRMRCMSFDPEQRPTFEELEQLVGVMPGVIHPPPPSIFSKFGARMRKFFGKI